MPSRSTDIRVTGTALFLLPVKLRVPLKFGGQVVEEVTCARVAAEVCTSQGLRAVGWGETPLAVQWGWPSSLPYPVRRDAMVRLAAACAEAICDFPEKGHAMAIGHAFEAHRLDDLALAAAGESIEAIPRLAALICLSPLDLAIHDAYGKVHGVDTFATYTAEYLSRDLADFLGDQPEAADRHLFKGRYPADFLAARPATTLLAWHLVGGLDPLEAADLTGSEPDDGHPLLLADWIRRDGLTCLKIKLRGDDIDWDIARLLRVGAIGLAHGATRLCADFNCTVSDPAYVHGVLDAIASQHPVLAGQLLYVEQPFPYDLAAHPIDVHSIAARTRLFLDESAHDWRHVAAGRALGWNGVALKTCKTQTGAMLSLAWARAHGMDIMVQDLTNPMLAAIPHVRLAAHAGTLAGVETNASQFYPEASVTEASVHPGIYRRRNGMIDLRSLSGPGFGMRVEEIPRCLPEPLLVAGTLAADGWRVAAVP
ncbi:MAG: mandelate racemase/muconate lactonizing enzyme family protein [Planctomycetes bacterium]|nr:mandelate racemase/muconate lactonizing enzyme family protein [Planctomycetota bacterium]